MQNLTAPQLIAAAILFLAAEIAAIGYGGLKLAAHRAPDVRIICYLISLASLATYIGMKWAQTADAIDSKGTFQGQLGAAINSILKFLLDLNSDVYVFGSILALFVVPQFLSYILAGLFGCASAPILVGRAVSFFVWALVKSFVTVAGILFTITVYGYANSWKGWDLRGMVGASSLSFTLLLVAIFVLKVYRDIHKDIISVDGSTARPLAISRTLGRIHAWLTRHVC
jgi:hypothetical protein